MKKIYFTPGPSHLYHTVPDHLKTAMNENIGSISHRSTQFKSIFQRTVESLRELLSVPSDHSIVFTSSATEVWERLIQNNVKRHSLHLVNGAFSKRFATISMQLGKSAETIEVAEGGCALLEGSGYSGSPELIAFTHNETSTGAMHPMEDVAFARENYPEALIALDVVSSSPYVNIDWSVVDTAYFSVQKCFGLPAGLGVWIFSPRCVEKSHQIKLNGSYHSIPSLLEKAVANQTPETPNVLNIYLLGQVANDMINYGLERIRRDTDYKAAVLYNFAANNQLFEALVEDDRYKSKTVIVFKCVDGSKHTIDGLEGLGLIVGSGYGKYKEKQIRIANFPTHSKEQIEFLADSLSNLS